MKTSRQRVLNYLRKKNVATVHEISRAMKMTPANARHHLAILIEQGSVEISGKRITQEPGRPCAVYKVRSLDANNNLKDISGILLHMLLDDKDTQSRDEVFKNIAGRLIRGEINSNQQQSRRLNETIQQLNQMKYEARWEAHRDAPHIILENCPYLELVEEFPEICRMNKFIIEGLLGVEVTLSTKLEATQSGSHRCIFIVNT